MKSDAARRAARAWKRRNPEKVKAAKRQWYRRSYSKKSALWKARAKAHRLANIAKSKAAAREKHLRSSYGLTSAKVSAMLAEQRGNCAICKLRLIKPSVDHCHSSGKVRGLLCRKCNFGLGLFSDSVKILSSAIRYLKRTTSPTE